MTARQKVPTNQPISHHHSNHGNHRWAGWPWQTLIIDLCGAFPEILQGNRQILMLGNHFTPWYEALLQTGQTFSRILDEEMFSYFKVPEIFIQFIIRSSNLSIFRSAVLSRVAGRQWPRRATLWLKVKPRSQEFPDCIIDGKGAWRVRFVIA